MVYRTGFTTLNIKIKVKVISYNLFAFHLNIHIIISIHNYFQKDVRIFTGNIFLWNFERRCADSRPLAATPPLHRVSLILTHQNCNKYFGLTSALLTMNISIYRTLSRVRFFIPRKCLSVRFCSIVQKFASVLPIN